MNHKDHNQGASCHAPPGKKRPDLLLWGSVLLIVVFYGLHLMVLQSVPAAGRLEIFSSSVFNLVNTVWWGVVVGIVMIGALSKVPREFVTSILGGGGTLGGLVRATMAGVLLDLCSHGILMVGAKLYERGASTGQVMAFLIASPWNSFSLTLILVALIGLPWTITFIVLSIGIAITSGLIFEALTEKGILPANPNKTDLPEGFEFWREAKTRLSRTKFTPGLIGGMLWKGVLDSRVVVRWVFFGVILAALLRAFVSPDQFQTFFGPTLAGLGLTVLAATVIEVCSEGATPVAADLLTRAGAPGNSFAFLMTGVSTDYTEIMVLKDTTKSWKIALFLPLVTVPQILVVAWLIN